MKRLSFLLIVLSAVAATLSFMPAGTSGKGSKLYRSENPVPGRYIVVYDEKFGSSALNAADARQLAASYNGTGRPCLRQCVERLLRSDVGA
jgi:hypothetical protein